jgi:hypothetical protein
VPWTSVHDFLEDRLCCTDLLLELILLLCQFEMLSQYLLQIGGGCTPLVVEVVPKLKHESCVW